MRYFVSNLGRVAGPKGLMKGWVNKDGYVRIFLTTPGRRVSRPRSNIVAGAFLGPRPLNHHVAHNDGNSQNDALSNLRYATPKDNAADTYIHGTVRIGGKNHNSKLTIENVKEILANPDVPTDVFMKKFGVSRATIQHTRTRRIWKHVSLDEAKAR